MNSEKTNKKNIILETAKQVFAEKGFDGARVDEIAERAGVKKSLIYYHFDGKDHLLQEILNLFFDDYAKLLRSADEGNSTADKYMDFLGTNSDLLRVILIESLKKNTNLPTVFKAVEMLMQYEKESGEASFAGRPSNNKRMVIEFFTNLLPSVSFVCYKEAWSNYFKVDGASLSRDFNEAIEETHGEYHRNLVKTGSKEDE